MSLLVDQSLECLVFAMADPLNLHHRLEEPVKFPEDLARL
jgi:hypothetical protein